MNFRTGQMTYRKIAPKFLMLIAGFLVVAPRAVLAHPMGNFSISHFAGLRIEAGGVELRYILDMAEIPNLHTIKTIRWMPCTRIVLKLYFPTASS